jgi:hypothetical protein
MSENDWMELLEVNDRLEAEMIKGALEADGIPALLVQEAIGTLYVLPSMPISAIKVCVASEKLAEAQAWLEAYESGKIEQVDDDNAEHDDPDHE